MFSASSNWLDLPLTPPRWLAAAQVFLAILAAVALWTSSWSRWTLLLPLPVLAISLNWNRTGAKGRLHLLDDGSLRRVAVDRSEHPLVLLSSQSRGPLHVLRLSEAGASRAAIYCQPGNIDAAQHRRLRLWLQRFGSAASPDDVLGGAA